MAIVCFDRRKGSRDCESANNMSDMLTLAIEHSDNFCRGNAMKKWINEVFFDVEEQHCY